MKDIASLVTGGDKKSHILCMMHIDGFDKLFHIFVQIFKALSDTGTVFLQEFSRYLMSEIVS